MVTWTATIKEVTAAFGCCIVTVNISDGTHEMDFRIPVDPERSNAEMRDDVIALLPSLVGPARRAYELRQLIDQPIDLGEVEI